MLVYKTSFQAEMPPICKQGRPVFTLDILFNQFALLLLSCYLEQFDLPIPNDLSKMGCKNKEK